MVAAMTTTPRTAPPHTTPPRTAPARTHTSCFSFRLDAEWARLRTDRRSLRQARGWVVHDPVHPLSTLVTDATDLDVIIREHNVARHRPDPTT